MTVNRHSLPTRSSASPPQSRAYSEHALLTPTETSQLLIEGLQHSAVLQLRCNGRIERCSIEAERLLGYESRELQGQHFSVLFAPEELAQGARDQDLIRARDEGRLENVGWHRRCDGTRFLANVVITPRRRGVDLLGYGVVLREIAVDGASPLAPRAPDAHLLARIAELEHLDQRKNTFLIMVSHELRNPLSAILSSLEILRHEGASEAIQRQARDMAERQVWRLTGLVNDLLEATRLMCGKISLYRKPLDLRWAAERAAETCRPLIERRLHEFDVILPNEPLWLDADPARIEQVIANLLTNAAKYTPDGGLVSLTLWREDGEAVLSVKDTGKGIPADQLSSIFDLFTQVDRDGEDGLGVGLSVVRTLVTMHEGTVEASSPGVGKGSAFVVRLPTCPPPEDATDGQPSRLVGASTSRDIDGRT